MWTNIDRRARRNAVKRRVRRKISGDAAKPRLAVFRSRKHFYIQAVDDATSTTICSASTLDPTLGNLRKCGSNVAAAKAVGALIADRLKEKGIATAIFDRGGHIYHGRVRAAAEAAREKGLKF